jgi:TetR/AcrR family fatty acid metabolism transcriptional regulator
MIAREDAAQERKAQICQAALTCFHRKGYHLTTMDDIASESGLSKGTLYWYFPSKKDLFIAMFLQAMDQFGQGMAAIAAGEDSAAGKLRAMLSFFRGELTDLSEFFGIMMEAWILTRHDEDVEDLVRDLYLQYVDLMTSIVKEGVANGEFNVASPEAVSLVMMALFDGITLSLGTGFWQVDWNEIMDAAESLVLRGLGMEGIDGG